MHTKEYDESYLKRRLRIMADGLRDARAENAALKAKLADAEADNAALKAENAQLEIENAYYLGLESEFAALKANIKDASAENDALKTRMEQVTKLAEERERNAWEAHNATEAKLERVRVLKWVLRDNIRGGTIRYYVADDIEEALADAGKGEPK